MFVRTLIDDQPNHPISIRPLVLTDKISESFIDDKNNKCQENKCKIIAYFNLPKETKATHCYLHKKEGMINIRSNSIVTVDEKPEVGKSADSPAFKLQPGALPKLK